MRIRRKSTMFYFMKTMESIWSYIFRFFFVVAVFLSESFLTLCSLIISRATKPGTLTKETQLDSWECLSGADCFMAAWVSQRLQINLFHSKHPKTFFRSDQPFTTFLTLNLYDNGTVLWVSEIYWGQHETGQQEGMQNLFFMWYIKHYSVSKCWWCTLKFVVNFICV